MIERIQSLKFLPQGDKDVLRHFVSLSYGHAQAQLPKLSIFRQGVDCKELSNYRYYEIENEYIYYVGCYSKTNLSIFFDANKKIIYGSRFYLSHLNAFVENIDACLFHLNNVNITDCIDVGRNYISIEKWFQTYGHFKDEVFNLAAFAEAVSTAGDQKVIVDYPIDSRLDTTAFRFNSNYCKIDQLALGCDSTNAYLFGEKILRLRDIKIARNGFNCPTFHSFPPIITKKILTKICITSPAIVGSRIFVTRSDSYRDIGNKREVEKYFFDRGFTLINPERLSYEDFVTSISKATFVVMYYGSAMTNMIYLPKNTKVAILRSQSYSEEILQNLWGKLIKNYCLNVTEIHPVSNMISELDLGEIVGL